MQLSNNNDKLISIKISWFDLNFNIKLNIFLLKMNEEILKVVYAKFIIPFE